MLFRFCDQIIQHRVITGVVAVRSGDLAAFSRHMLNLRLAVGRTTLRTRLNQGAEIVMPSSWMRSLKFNCSSCPGLALCSVVKASL
ncbi:Uncharacterised protein [Leclercia adecarboxylata]|uniref:Uncharacterized protein n=1 Tax=Leclercia adecarboxylata TaxID=83655 RepID=A0A4U9I7G8_9ENTR|nr:Uncharacterised protein [Leclercia adecarboxylata]